jgi:hypothetical protein
MEFLETFETHHNIKSGSRADGRVTLDEWVEYYSNVSASIDNDEYFHLMMNNAWNLSGDAATYKKFDKGWQGDEKTHWSPPKKPQFLSTDRPMTGYYRGKNYDGMVVQRSGFTSENNPLTGDI